MLFMKSSLLVSFVLFVVIFNVLAVLGSYRMRRDYDEPYVAAPSYNYNPYSFGYEVDDNYGNKQWRQEKSQHPQSVQGSYGYRDKQGIYREVYYIADKNGFRANVRTNEPGTAPKDPASVRLDALPAPYQPSTEFVTRAEAKQRFSYIRAPSSIDGAHDSAYPSRYASYYNIPQY